MLPLPIRNIRSLKSRLALWVLLPTVLISAIDLVSTWVSTDQIATLVQQQLLKGSAKIISEQLAGVEGDYEINVPPAALELFANGHRDRVFYSVRSKEGRLIVGDDGLARYGAPLQVDQEAYFVTVMRGQPVRVIAYAHALPSTTTNDYAITQVAQTLKGHDAFRRDLMMLTIREHLLLLVIVVLALIVAFRWTLRPLNQFGATLLARRPGSLETLDASSVPIELAPVIFAINDYAARLDKTINAYQQFVANTAHHLRTSFAIVTSQINFGMRQAQLDQSQREVLEAIRKTVVQATRVINQLLVLATLEHGQQPFVALNLAELIKIVLDEFAPLAQQRHIELGVDDMDELVMVSASRALLRELLSNLLANAILHGHAEGSVTVGLMRAGSTAVLRMVDTGPGIPADQRDKVFERFYRLDRSKPEGSGLGLAIVLDIADRLQASVSLRTPDNGIGLCVEVVFPLAAAGTQYT
ncbi:two-component system sensor histidine kinase TctE [Actimicrobium sp. GrIS 1.19]|uniref:sensor histidine kinase n=1 Tax=Actimicrobium sp. GrIS 1.19 TaxID=3071708 RepID=UPI002DFEC900|nr:two-component system sensor histidine kinase TctE [Actimicrobium sp. GrIS 1.19]